MKYFNKISILLLIGIIPFSIRGQSSRFQLGVEGGLSLVTIRYDMFFFPSKYWEAGLGGTIGVGFKYNINDQLAIKTNLSFEKKGTSSSYESKDRLNYIILPLLLQVKFGKTRLFFANFGPYVGYLLPMTRYIDYYKKIDFGVSMGIGINIPVFHQFSLTFEFRNNLGLLNISKNVSYIDKHGNPVIEIGNLYTNTIIIQSGLIYNFGRKKAK